MLRSSILRRSVPLNKLTIIAVMSLLLCPVCFTPGHAAEPDWENEQVFGRHKEQPRASAMVYPNKSLAVQDQRDASPWFQSLNGKWRFYWSPDPDHRPADFYQPDYDVSGWGQIAVPGNWQTQGYGVPVYTNITYPFQQRPAACHGRTAGQLHELCSAQSGWQLPAHV